MENKETKRRKPIIVRKEKKKVFIMVPIEKSDDEQIEKDIAVAKADYCAKRKIKETDAYFYDYIHDFKQLLAGEEMNENHVKRKDVDELSWMVSMCSGIDDAIFGENWNLSRSCKAIGRICELYYIPHIKVMKTENKNEEIENSEKMKEFRKKHRIDVMWK